MKEFLEKRWWQGVGGIAGVIGLVLVILQFRGIINISGLAVSIALNIIFATVLVVLAIWGTRWKRKYEVASDRIEEIQRLVEAQKKVTELKRVLLPDPSNISKLNIDNVLLNELYGQAYGRAVNKYHDAKLNSLAILVHPYNPTKDKVAIHFDFYSEWADRLCSFGISEVRDMHEFLPDKPADMFEKATFDELPWIRDQNWQQFLKKASEKAGPLSPAPWTNYILSARAGEDPQWSISFTDGVTGKEFRFDWDGEGEPMPQEEFG